MDRGFVFKQINNYINCFMPGEPKVMSLRVTKLCDQCAETDVCYDK